jgi:hypothetical protein
VSGGWFHGTITPTTPMGCGIRRLRAGIEEHNDAPPARPHPPSEAPLRVVEPVVERGEDLAEMVSNSLRLP